MFFIKAGQAHCSRRPVHAVSEHSEQLETAMAALPVSELDHGDDVADGSSTRHD